MGDMRGPVTVRDGAVYAISGEGWVGAWNAADGSPIWAKPLKPDYESGRPLAINNTAPVPTEHGLLCADWRSTQQLLDYETGETIAEFPVDVGHYAAFATVHKEVMFAVRRGRADAIRVPSGEAVWQAEETSRSISAPIVIGEKLIYSGSSGLRARNVKTGELLWQAGHGNAGYQNAIPVVWDDVLLANGEHPRVFDLETGEPGWRVFCAQDARRRAISALSSAVDGR